MPKITSSLASVWSHLAIQTACNTSHSLQQIIREQGGVIFKSVLQLNLRIEVIKIKFNLKKTMNMDMIYFLEGHGFFSLYNSKWIYF